MSVSIQAKRPLFEPLRHGAKTEAFEEYIRSIRQALEARGVEILAFVRVTSGRQHFFGQRAASGIGVRIGILLAT